MFSCVFKIKLKALTAFSKYKAGKEEIKVYVCAVKTQNVVLRTKTASFRKRLILKFLL